MTSHPASMRPDRQQSEGSVPLTASNRITVTNPATGAVVASLDPTTDAQLDAMFDTARAAQERWATTPLGTRARILGRFHDLLFDRADLILDTIQSESGKARRDALTEIATVAGTARYYRFHGSTHLRERRVRGAVPIATSARVQRRPVGVVGMITPWNYPFILGIADSLPALLAGNAVVTKPSEQTPMSTLAARDLLIDAGLDPDLLHVVLGPGSKIGKRVVERADYVGFTGSSTTGAIIARQAADRMVPCSLELGGKNAMIVLRDAPVEHAVNGLILGAFTNSGQTCISTERVIVHADVYDQFVERAAARVGALRVGWSTGWDMDMGSLISSDHVDAVATQVRDGLDAGARAIVGGRRLDDLGTAFFAPTILVDAAPDLAVSCEETFGPVVTVHRVQSTQEAIDLANDTPYGLNASVWTGNRQEARRIADQLHVGSVNINATLLIYNTFAAPMGGVGISGIGRRHAREGILRFTSPTSIVTSTRIGGGYDRLAGVSTSQPRANRLLRILRLMSRIPGLR